MTYFRGLRSIKVISLRCARNDWGVSATTCSTRRRVYASAPPNWAFQHILGLTLRYSMKRLRKATKCSAFRMFPGTASSSISLDNTDVERVSPDGLLRLGKRPTRARKHILVFACIIGLLQTRYQLFVLVLQLRGICVLYSDVSESRMLGYD
jgi:hypothetical protein